MNRLGWACVEATASILQPRDREVVLGDLAEFEAGFWRGFYDVLGVAARRQLPLWKSWRPWAASLCLAWPASLFLMGNSVAVTGTLLYTGQWSEGLSQLGLLTMWALAAGITVASISQKTIWASALAFVIPYCFCLSLWPGSWLGAMRLLLFVAPAVGGAWLARSHKQLVCKWAVLISVAAGKAPLMALMHSPRYGWYGLGTLLPPLYLAFMTLQTKRTVSAGRASG
ncbi:MAG TPA: hypothetical protein VIM62_02970 [Acidobacteriaceae bacterium]